MKLFKSFVAASLFASSWLLPLTLGESVARATDRKIAPKVFILSMFEPEAEVWWGIPEFNLLAHNITVPGASPLFPNVHCTEDFQVCQLVTGETEINAAVTVSPLASSVTFARFAVQVALQGAYAPNQYPTSIYGTEVFEVNAELRSMAAAFARKAQLADNAIAKQYRSLYATPEGIYAAATKDPSVLECDTATSDVYFSGHYLGDAFADFTTLMTSGKGQYCSTQQEDNATLEALLRAAAHGVTDFARVIIMRTASDFDRAHSNQTAMDNLFYADQGAFEPARGEPLSCWCQGCGGTPPTRYLKNTTLRQTIRLPLGTDTIRLRLSNAFGLTDLPVTNVSVALTKRHQQEQPAPPSLTWPDLLQTRLNKYKSPSQIAIAIALVNQAAGGNRILADGLGPNTLSSRLDRDVLAHSAITHAVVFEDVNDIGVAESTPAAQTDTGDRLLGAYVQPYSSGEREADPAAREFVYSEQRGCSMACWILMPC
ncbi:hypothetical protein AOCH_005039 [Aspergillus ochraceoroseus]|uniref:Purine nucleoside permease n=1 Tax=Aspergillus ochraceoroseus TaxID=138278 RepID=A0A0F8VPK7_9EURO|nr:hypothetical protein AOCH_005039 [Aspergillus ochraceoroseus]